MAGIAPVFFMRTSSSSSSSPCFLPKQVQLDDTINTRNRRRAVSLPSAKFRSTSFGATAPPFIDYLKDILRRYPDGGQILKELIQNADDAGATEVVFIHDERSYGTESLWTEELGKYQGPALYAYNNATFTDEDWQGIQMAGRSVKRDDPNKVGRFGIGFNSVYHTTDVPSIFSSGHLGMMDPQEKIFGERNGGFWWSLDDAEDQEVLLNMRDQFQPFRDIVSLVCEHGWSKVVMEDQHFSGTIFRFPLRNEASEISDNLYDSDKVVELFDSFIADADLSLLFLKNVTSVSLLHISEDGAVNTRLQVKSSVPTDGVLEPEEESVTEGLTRFKVITVSSKDQKETKWLLTTCTMKEGVAEDLDLLTKKLSFLPQVDLAFPCGEKRDCSQSRLSYLSSYIGKMPKEFLPYKKLLQKFGLRKVLSNEEILGILYNIQQNVEARQQPIASSSEVKVSIEILNWLWKEKKTVQDDIPVPVIAEGGKFTLKPRSTALFCDVSKNGLKELNCREEEIYVIHEEIPKAAAEWLEIRFLSTHILDPEEIGIEQCGQSEPITMRIKNILKEYDEDSDIFKELIQNAEDAGAAVCKFLVDFRVHKDAPESLIDPDMALCQGPCLWAFNNEQFTAEDWKNIVRVGSASKENKVEKIGKFGLGFNTVYHVTDVPSILSGNTLLILDPNVTHLTKHIKHKTNPGIKLDLSQQRLFHCFPGQFGSYKNIFDCNFTRKSPPEPYPGTLIKLPFRSQEEAAKSEINPKVYQKHNILDFQHLFSKNSQTHLLFLKNIITLSLQNIPHNGSTPPRENEIETIFSVSKTTVSAMEIPDDTSVSKQRHAEKSLMKLDGKCKEVINCCKFSIVKISSQQSNENEVQLWLLYNCFGTDESLKMALQKNKQASFSLPIGGIAVPLQNDPETGKFSTLQTDLVGQAFCFLPLPIHTGLPVNVNGTFAVTSNRKVDGKLYPSSTLCYNDTVFETKRLEEALENKFLLLEKLSECHLGNDKYMHHQLLQLLPQKFQPKMLSEFTEERVVESEMQLLLGQLLMCDDLQDVRKTLAKNQIRDSAETESSSFSPAAPGTEVPEEWHDCLDMNVLNNFEEGEYVGYSIDDKYIYAVIVEELPGHNGRYSWRYKIDIGEDEPIEVSCVDLFQFKREKKVKTERRKCMEPELQKKMLKPEENTCMELEPLAGAVPHSSESSINSLPASVQEAKREIDKCLAEIWRLPEEERHKAIKRLYLRWHPDKNPDCQSLASEAFKYLQN
ncbi:sacsin-like [Pundamilia nyererei]|uniref:Sacsin-like n=1 Tax=Pundamilia nyererei TaxID=303518 RepID=A0A9Y6J8H7_9CICH|nr:PREDICTED: sacsin-like [Pundamilia nyererei]